MRSFFRSCRVSSPLPALANEVCAFLVDAQRCVWRRLAVCVDMRVDLSPDVEATRMAFRHARSPDKAVARDGTALAGPCSIALWSALHGKRRWDVGLPWAPCWDALPGSPPSGIPSAREPSRGAPLAEKSWLSPVAGLNCRHGLCRRQPDKVDFEVEGDGASVEGQPRAPRPCVEGGRRAHHLHLACCTRCSARLMLT